MWREVSVLLELETVRMSQFVPSFRDVDITMIIKLPSRYSNAFLRALAPYASEFYALGKAQDS